MRGEKHLVGHEDGVDDVNDTVRLEDIGCGDGGHAAFGVGEHDFSIRHRGCEVFALNGFESGFAAALLDHLCELLRADPAGDDVIGEDFDEGVFVLRLDEGVDGAGGEFGEGIVSRGEDGEGTGAVEGVDEACSLDGCDEGLVDGRVDCVLNDGLVGIHGSAAYIRIFLGMGAK